MKRGAMEKHTMQQKLASKSNPKIIVSVVGVLLLVVGISFTLDQVAKPQNNQSHAAGGDCTVTTAQLAIKPQEQTMFDAVNAYRVANGKPALTWSAGLKKPAAWMSADMLKSRNLSHTDSLGRTPDMRLPDCGFTIQNSYGENIANGAPAPTQVLMAWEQDPAHNTILLNTAYTQTGIDMELDSTGQIAFFTMDLAGPTTSTAVTTAVSSAPTQANGVTVTPTQTTTPNATGAPSAAVQPSTDPNAVSPTLGPLTVDMQLAVKVKIAGIGLGGNLYPKHLSRHVQAMVYGTAATPIVTGTTYLTYDGSNFFTGTIHFGKMNGGVYLVKLVGDNTLQMLAKPEFQNLSVNQVNVLPPVTLIQGDLTGDNILNIDDYNAALPCFQNKTCATAALIDFNDDGRTDVTDYNLFLQSFLQAQGN